MKFYDSDLTTLSWYLLMSIASYMLSKYATEALRKGRNLKGTTRYWEGNKVFVNNSFCSEFKFLNFVIRKAARDKVIHRYKIRNGVTSIQMTEDSNYIEIGHVLDLENQGITIRKRKTYT